MKPNEEQKLLADVENDLLAGKPLGDLLRKCIVLGGRLQSPDLRNWASQELRGYSNEQELPPYRTVAAPLFVDAVTFNARITGQQISARDLPDFVQERIREEVELRGGVGELEANVRQGREGKGYVSLTFPMSADVARFMNSENGDPSQTITAIYWKVSVTVIEGILDMIRTQLSELIAELRASAPFESDVITPDKADQAVQVVLHGKRARATVTTSQAAGTATATVNEPSAPEPGWWTLGRIVWAGVIGVATIAAAVFAYMALK